MMKSIRTAAKPIYIIVAVAFVGTIIFAWGMDITGKGQGGQRPANVVGKINDEEVSLLTFSQTYRSKYDELLQTNTDPSEEDLEKLRDDTWNSLVGQVLMAQQIDKYNIRVTPEELTEYVKAMPPRELVQIEDFQTDGQFDPAKYQNYLQNLATSSDPQAEQVLLYLESTVKSQIMINKLQEMVISTVYIAKDEVLEDYRTKNEKTKVKYALISNADIDTSGLDITEQMIRNRYEQDKEESYKTDESATLQYVSFMKEPSEADKDSVKNEISVIYDQIKNGGNFEDLAKEYSQDGSASKGGDLGWFGKGRMVKPFEEAAFALKKNGDISEPILSQFGWHIIKLTGKRNKNDKGEPEEQIKASHILLKTDLSAQTLADLKDAAELFRQEAIGYSFEKAAEDKSYEIQTTPSFNKGGSIRGVGMNESLNKLAFDGEEGQVSEVVDTRNYFMVATKGTHNPAGYKPFDEVKDRIESTLRREILADKAYVKGQELYQEMVNNNMTLKQICSQEDLNCKDTEYFSRNDFIKNIGSDAGFIGAAFSLSENNKLSQPVKSRSGCYLIEYINNQPIDITEYEAVSDSLFKEYSKEKRQNTWREWYRQVYENAVIEDYREEIYGS